MSEIGVKVTELVAITALDDTDYLYCIHVPDGTDGSKKITVANVRKLMIGGYINKGVPFAGTDGILKTDIKGVYYSGKELGIGSVPVANAGRLQILQDAAAGITLKKAGILIDTHLLYPLTQTSLALTTSLFIGPDDSVDPGDGYMLRVMGAIYTSGEISAFGRAYLTGGATIDGIILNSGELTIGGYSISVGGNSSLIYESYYEIVDQALMFSTSIPIVLRTNDAGVIIGQTDLGDGSLLKVYGNVGAFSFNAAAYTYGGYKINGLTLLNYDGNTSKVGVDGTAIGMCIEFNNTVGNFSSIYAYDIVVGGGCKIAAFDFNNNYLRPAIGIYGGSSNDQPLLHITNVGLGINTGATRTTYSFEIHSGTTDAPATPQASHTYVNAGQIKTYSLVSVADQVRIIYDPVTLERGTQIKLKNKTGSATVKGQIVASSPSTNNAFETCAGNAYDPTNIVYESGVADGSDAWVWVIGSVCQVLLKNSTASTRDYWVKISDTAGRADATTAAPPGGTISALEDHSREIGHSLESKTAGTNVLALINFHLN